MTNYIYRADLTGLNVSGTPTVFSYATEEYMTTPAHGTKPNQHYAAKLAQPLLLQRDMYGPGRTYGDAEIPHGECILSNEAGELDEMLNYGFDGQLFELWKIDPAAPDTELLEFRGTMESLTLDLREVRVLIRDPVYVFDVALQSTKFAGNNSLPNGLEGSSDLAGKPKPVLYGNVNNIEPPCVNTTRLIYQLHDGLMDVSTFFVDVRDKGVGIGDGILRTLAEFQAGATSKTVSSIDTATDTLTSVGHGIATAAPVHVAATTTMPGGLLDTQYYYLRSTGADTFTLHPSAAHATAGTNKVDVTSAGTGTITVATNRTPYSLADWCLDVAGSYIRLGSTPVGKVTADTSNRVSGVLFTEQILMGIANRFGAHTLDSRAASGGGQTGFFATEEMSAYEAMRQVAKANNLTFQVYPNRSAGLKLTTQRLETPTGSSVVALDSSNVLSLGKVQPGDESRGIPAWRINLGYGKIWTPMSASDLAAGVPLSTVSFIGKPEQVLVDEDASVKDRFPLAPELTFHTYLNSNVPSSFVAYLSALYCALSDMFSVKVKQSVFADVVTTSGGMTIPGPMLGMNVSLAYPRFDLDAGRAMVILGYVVDYAAGEIDLTLWSHRP